VHQPGRLRASRALLQLPDERVHPEERLSGVQRCSSDAARHLRLELYLSRRVHCDTGMLLAANGKRHPRALVLLRHRPCTPGLCSAAGGAGTGSPLPITGSAAPAVRQRGHQPVYVLCTGLLLRLSGAEPVGAERQAAERLCVEPVLLPAREDVRGGRV